MGRNESELQIERRQAEFEAAVEAAIRDGDPEFAVELLLSCGDKPPKVIEWLEERARAEEPKTAPVWHETIRGYAQHYLNKKSYDVYTDGDLSELEKARDRALMTLGRREPTQWSP